MFHWLNGIDAVLCPIEWTQQAITHIQPYAQSAWQMVTAGKTQRVLRAISLAVVVMGTIVLVGIVKVARIGWQEAAITFRAQLDPIGDPSPETPAIEVAQAQVAVIEPEAISPQTGVRTLRQVATQRGIRNAGRMRKPELLAVLQLS